MPASGGIRLLDANVWLALAFSDHLHHSKAKEWLGAQHEGAFAFCRVTQMALLRHLSNSKIIGACADSTRRLEALRATCRRPAGGFSARTAQCGRGIPQSESGCVTFA